MGFLKDPESSPVEEAPPSPPSKKAASSASKKNVPKVCRSILKDLIDRVESTGSGKKDANARILQELQSVRKRLTADPNSYAGTAFADDVHRALESNRALLEVFESEWKTQYASQQQGSSGSPVGRAAASSEQPSSNASAVGARAKRSKEFSDKEKKSIQDKLVGLSARGLVEAIHVAKRNQPELDFGNEPSRLVLNLDDMNQEALTALDNFLRKN